ncbi:hypothetical protein WJX75_005460 [Coccomyxa subellipsoidea]|uniref:Serine aminopeptidase S33 domain-containing protein n=1 Tax=Coccomyxa subellipsoidea TaxID=248742 RepID=A0ABR2YMM7_9CHLO
MIEQGSRIVALESLHVPNRWCPSRNLLHAYRRGNPVHLISKRRSSCFYKAAAATLNAGDGTFPHFVPEQVSEIQEEAALNMIRSMERCRLEVPSLGQPVDTAYAEITGDQTPIVLLHGFDSSLLEFRRLFPLLREAGATAYAVDLIGWGFSCCGFHDYPNLQLGPQQKTDHLYEFWRKKVQRPMVLCGVSLGSAIAVQFALQHPEAVAGLVLSSPQVYVDGIGPMASMPWVLSYLGVQVLKTRQLRGLANQMAYHDKERLATDDALRIGRLHTFLPGWTNSNIAFMKSGGYTKRLPKTSLTPG